MSDDLSIEDRNASALPTTRAAKHMVPGDVVVCILGTCVVMEKHKIPAPLGTMGHLLLRLREYDEATDEINLKWDIIKCTEGACFRVVFRVPGSPAMPEGDAPDTKAGWKDPDHLSQALEDSP